LDKHAPRKAPLFLVLWKGQRGFWIFVFPLDPTNFPMMLNINVVPKFPHVPQVIPIAEQFIISFAQNSTLVNYITRSNEHIIKKI
jgi:hypothetical protein